MISLMIQKVTYHHITVEMKITEKNQNKIFWVETSRVAAGSQLHCGVRARTTHPGHSARTQPTNWADYCAGSRAHVFTVWVLRHDWELVLSHLLHHFSVHWLQWCGDVTLVLSTADLDLDQCLSTDSTLGHLTSAQLHQRSTGQNSLLSILLHHHSDTTPRHRDTESLCVVSTLQHPCKYHVSPGNHQTKISLSRVLIYLLFTVLSSQSSLKWFQSASHTSLNTRRLIFNLNISLKNTNHITLF